MKKPNIKIKEPFILIRKLGRRGCDVIVENLSIEEALGLIEIGKYSIISNSSDSCAEVEEDDIIKN